MQAAEHKFLFPALLHASKPGLLFDSQQYTFSKRHAPSVKQKTIGNLLQARTNLLH
jgi:hypothetical protein